MDQDDIISSLQEWGHLSHSSSAVSGRNSSPLTQHGVVEKVTSTVAATLMEVALSRLVGVLI